MDTSHAIDLTQQALLQVFTLSAPALVAALVIALTTGVLQTITQIQDATLSAVPKLLGVTLVLALCLSWLLERLVAYSHDLIQQAPRLLSSVP
ncbi:MAG: flagellar biosynthetic protein FliQ [Planctomycetota bacterium]